MTNKVTYFLSLFTLAALLAGGKSVAAGDSLVFSDRPLTPLRLIGIQKLSGHKGKSAFMQRMDDDPVTTKYVKNYLSGLTVGGYFRGYGFSRKFTTPYGNYGATKIMDVGDGFYDPMMFMYVGGTPTPTTSFGSEIILANPFEAYRGPGTGTRSVNLYFSLVLRGSINTKKFGNYNIVAGGIEWRQLTPFTFGTNVGYNRYSIFERRPWDPVGNIKTRYASYYYSGTINQDVRFGTNPFKGFMISGFNMPFKTTLDVFYGKTQMNAGITRDLISAPKSNLGVKLTKTFKGDNKIGLNTFNSFVTPDSITGKKSVQWNIFTTEFDLNIKDIKINGETGFGGYQSPTYSRKWSGAFIANISIPKKYTLLPFNLRYFDIGYNFTSNVAQFNNVTIREVTTGYNPIGSGGVVNGAVVTPFGANINNVGDLANNRRGAVINTEVKLGKVKMIIGNQVAQDINRFTDRKNLTFGHRINALTWSRLPGFPFYGTFGPANRVGTFYRGVYENVKISDTLSDGSPMTKIAYNALDVQFKYKDRIFGKDFYVYSLNTFVSGQNKLSPIPLFTNAAYIRGRYHELECYYQLHRDFILSLYLGYEVVKGNSHTDLNASGQARDQKNEALGIGFDWALSQQTALFFRQRWFSFEDKNFVGEKFNGNEATIELKIFF
ncbi:MAG: hypothetical protein ACJ75J_05075 [Cytophagaceae bacterium]